MDGDIGAMLQSVLSDPEQMAKITQMAQSLMKGQEAPTGLPAPETANTASEAPAAAQQAGGTPVFSEGEAKLFSALGKAFASSGGKSRSTALLVAMRPYMKPEKQEKLDRAMKLAKMVHVAGAVMKEYGGGASNGL